MRRIGVFSDLHADGDALDVLWAAMDREHVDGTWCLGDFCSGGPDPVRCYEQVLDRCEVVLGGNHELFVIRRSFDGHDAAWATDARAAHAQLGHDRRRLLSRLRYSGIAAGIACVHGTPANPVMGFLSSKQSAAAAIAAMRGRTMLYGHTHVAAWWEPGDPWPARRDIVCGEAAVAGAGALLNPGAANDPRGVRWMTVELGGDGLADGEALEVRWHREPRC